MHEVVGKTPYLQLYLSIMLRELLVTPPMMHCRNVRNYAFRSHHFKTIETGKLILQGSARLLYQIADKYNLPLSAWIIKKILCIFLLRTHR
jgi:hypothetical protein